MGVAETRWFDHPADACQRRELRLSYREKGGLKGISSQISKNEVSFFITKDFIPGVSFEIEKYSFFFYFQNCFQNCSSFLYFLVLD